MDICSSIQIPTYLLQILERSVYSTNVINQNVSFHLKIQYIFWAEDLLKKGIMYQYFHGLYTI